MRQLAPDTSVSPPAASARLPTTVLAFGVTSFFTDVGSEMIFPLLPLFLTSLGTTPAFIGLIEGLAEATSSLLKLASGYVADRVPRKKPLVLLGYGIAALVRPLVGFATLPVHVLAVRVTDRLGKGIRTAPRDALIAAAVPSHMAGRAFGLHRAMDHAGAVVGPLIATLLLGAGMALRDVFLVAVVPGVLAMIALIPVREQVVPPAPVRAADVAAAGSPSSALPRTFYIYLAILVLFSLGASTDAFLLLRAREVGVDTALIPTLWVVHHVAKLLATWYGGRIADRLPRLPLIAGGFGVYALTYIGFGFASEPWHAWALFVWYGVYFGLAEPSERALIKDLAPASAHGRAFGLYHFAIGISAIPASSLTGWVWQSAGARPALWLCAAIATGAAFALAAFGRSLRGQGAGSAAV